MAPSTVPVSADRFRVEAYHNIELFSQTAEDPSTDPEMVTHANTFTGANLQIEC